MIFVFGGILLITGIRLLIQKETEVHPERNPVVRLFQRFVPLTAVQRFTALQSGEVDLLSRNTTWSMSRETDYALNFAAVSYYDGQGFMLRRQDARMRRVIESTFDGLIVTDAAGDRVPEAPLAARLQGRTRCNKIVVFEGADRHIGQLMDLKIERVGSFTLYGDPAILNL
mgnify:CR=1 FL=1